jgi:hypothetical protein
LATLRRDGFASMDAHDAAGTLTTRPVSFQAKYLFVNVDSREGGELRVEILDQDGKVIQPFTREECVPLTADKTLLRVKWNGANELPKLAGRPVRFRFHLKNARLYAFWVSPDASGVSNGFVAGGGPGLAGHRDTIGAKADR